MLMAPESLARYWRCGGEIMALGGPLPLRVAGRMVGCRPISPVELRRLAAIHRQAGAEPYHQFCLRDAEAVLAALQPAC